MFCPNCGVENPDTAVECRRCHVPFEEPPADTGGHASLADEQEESTHVDAGMQAAQQEGSESFGTVCRRCEAFNEPGVDRCTNCGYKLSSDDAPAAPAHEAAAPEHEAALDHTPPTPHPIGDTANEAPLPDTTPPSGQPSLSDELQALAISDEDARSAQSADQTPPEGVPAMHPEAHH
ncbi:MAG: hypothetical protein JST92_20455, partial [Deltaproteobacteria bacterium]|nr:hypothetical protein [Deltaproteobacteria bacterium]